MRLMVGASHLRLRLRPSPAILAAQEGSLDCLHPLLTLP